MAVDDLVKQEGPIHVSLTNSPLDILGTMDRVRSPKAGAIVMFAGTTRDNFKGKAVQSLTYISYAPLALKTLFAVAKDCHERHGLVGIAIVHRLGNVPIGEDSVLIFVSAPHRQAAWTAGEEALEKCKSMVEIWKREEFVDGGGVWRANDNALQLNGHGTRHQKGVHTSPSTFLSTHATAGSQAVVDDDSGLLTRKKENGIFEPRTS